MTQPKLLTYTLLLFMPLFPLAGCESLGYVVGAITGEDKIPAIYELKDVPTVVIIEDSQHLLPRVTLAHDLARKISTLIYDNEIIKTVVPPVEVEELLAKQPTNTPLNVYQLAKTVKAKQIIHVVIGGYELSDLQKANHSKMLSLVRVIDVETGKRIFPSHPNQDYHAVNSTVWANDPSINERPYVDQFLSAQQLVLKAGTNIAQLFYEHEKPEMGQRFKNR